MRFLVSCGCIVACDTRILDCDVRFLVSRGCIVACDTRILDCDVRFLISCGCIVACDTRIHVLLMAVKWLLSFLANSKVLNALNG